MTLPRGFICFFRQLAHLREEFCGLAEEQSASLEACDRLLRTEDFCRDRDRANDRNFRKIPAEERAGLGHDQIGLEVLPAKRRCIEVWKREAAKGQRSQWSRNRVACLVRPSLEVHGLGRADAQQDPQYHWIGDPQGQCWGRGWCRLAR